MVGPSLRSLHEERRLGVADLGVDIPASLPGAASRLCIRCPFTLIGSAAMQCRGLCSMQMEVRVLTCHERSSSCQCQRLGQSWVKRTCYKGSSYG